MIGYLIRFFLKLTRKNHLIQFFDGLRAIGKPTPVLYPGELLEQALLLGMSGLNNTLAIQSNQHWIWPYWVERQLNPDSNEFIPTGVNLLTTNLSFRNWTALSIYGNRLEAMMDPVGMLTMEPFSWSLMPYLIIDQEFYIPSKMDISNVKQSLHKKNWPEVITQYKTNKQIQWLSKCKALEMDQQQVLHQKFIIKNRSEDPCTMLFGVSLRPYNALTIGHIHKLSCKKNLWKVNGSPAMLMLTPADYLHTSNRLLGDPIFIKDHKNFEYRIDKTRLKSRSGISTGIAVYNITLQPGERVVYEFLASDQQSKALSIRKKNSQWKADIQDAIKQYKKYWKNRSQSGITIILPEKRIQNAFDAVKNHLHVFDDVEQFTPGSFFYHTGWFRDSTFLSLGFDQAGYYDQVKNKFDGYFKRQTFWGAFKSQDGEWDSTGQALFTVISHIRRSGNFQLLEKYYPALLRGGKWIRKTRLTAIEKNSPHYGLLPAGLSAEHFGPNDHYYWDNFWSLSGIQQLIWCAEQLKKISDQLWLEQLFHSYNQDLQKSITTATERVENKALPCSPYRWMDTAAIGNLAAVTPMHLISANENWVKPCVDYLWQNSVRKGLFFQHIIHSGYNIYLSIQLAKVLLIQQDHRWKIIFQAILAAASPTWTWPEAIHPKTGGGCMGDGDHGWAAAEFVSLIRDMFVFEQKDCLMLGAGIFSEWYDLLQSFDSTLCEVINKTINCQGMQMKNQSIHLSNAPSLYGTISYSLNKIDNDIVLQWTIFRNSLQAKVPAYFICPELLKYYSIDSEFPVSLNNTAIQLISDSGECRFNLIKKSHE